jgi:regulator of cell morphogenesis and NO signaling
MYMNYMSATLSDMASLSPKIANVFQQHAISLVENGYLTLHQQIKKLGVLAHEFKRSLQSALAEDLCEKATAYSQAELVSCIIKKFHEPHRTQLAAILNNARFVEQQNASHAQYPVRLVSMLLAFSEDLCSHMDQEELFLFPSLLEGLEPKLFPQVSLAHHTHDRHLTMMADIEAATHHFTPPSDASFRWQELYEQLDEFFIQLNIHIKLENTLLSAH